MSSTLITITHRQLDHKAFMPAVRKLYTQALLPMGQARELKLLIKNLSRSIAEAGELYKDKVAPSAPKEGELPSEAFLKAFEEFMSLPVTLKHAQLEPADFAQIQFTPEELDALEPLFQLEAVQTAESAKA